GGRREVAGRHVAGRGDSTSGRWSAGEYFADDRILAWGRGRNRAPASHADGVGAITNRVAGQGSGWTWSGAASRAPEGRHGNGSAGRRDRSTSGSAQCFALGEASHCRRAVHSSGIVRDYGCAIGGRAGTQFRSGTMHGARRWL